MTYFGPMAVRTCLRVVIAEVGGASTAKPKQIAEVISPCSLMSWRSHAEFFFHRVALLHRARESSRMHVLEIERFLLVYSGVFDRSAIDCTS